MKLFELASSFAKFGYHRTGSDSQLAAEAWLTDYLKQRGFSVQHFSFEYLHYQAATTLRQGGRVIESMPLYYEAVGEIKNSNNLAIGIVDTTDEEDAYEKILSLVKPAKSNRCDALVVGTDCASHSLYAFNVCPELKKSMPIVLVPGGEYERLDKEKVSLDFMAEAGFRKAHNLIARFDDASTRAPIVITTPMSGWFECAGERGTGVALAIALAEHLSKSNSVELVLASGHELGYLGGFEYSASLSRAPAAVIHLGSSLATFDSRLQAWSNIESSTFNDMDKVLSTLDIPLQKVDVPSQRSDWVGEAECWAHFNCPMLSVAGEHPCFHTPQDRIDSVTDEAELTKMFKVFTSLAESVATTV